MTELSLFTGGGGGVYASKLLGHKIIGYVEFNEYCQKIIKQRIVDGIFDNAPIFGDIREFDGTPYCGSVDIVSGGFPCQPFSFAGRKKGKDDSRNMWPETIRVIKQVKPKKAFLENVPGLLSSGYFGTILNDLSEAGYNARWITLSASDCGAPHKRERLWILAYSNTEHAGFDATEKRKSIDERNDGSEKRSESASKLERLDILADSNSTGLQETRTEQQAARTVKHSTKGWWSTERGICRVAPGMADSINKS